MRLLYSLLLFLLLPLVLLRLLWRSCRNPAYLERWPERLGLWRRALRPVELWIHAVSVGEVQAMQPLIRDLLSREPVVDLIVTTTTPTGARRLQELFGERVQHAFTPYDLPWIMRRFLNRTGPRLVLVVETEIWPNMLAVCAERQIPVILANARMSPRSARGYARVGGFTAQTLGRFVRIAAQSQPDAERFIQLGAAADRVQVTGSIKFDVRLPGSLRDRAEVLRRTWGINRSVWVAASTHEGEEERLLAVQRKLRERFADVLLVLVPRHPERFDRVAALVRREGLAMIRRSDADPCNADCSVYLVDSMGELPLFLAAADAAFIGGSLVPVGGHNLLEAAALAVPVAIGPYCFNFAEITRRLVAEEGAVQLQDAEDLAPLLAAWLGDAAERARIGEQALAFVERNRGALQRLLALLDAERLAKPPV
ncbi:MAG: lipid IV(A) 3-deoxy-D-manno-octulosonic acid transferase [Lamprobacter sp.]|uniref:lipid IV(A) 3-deoxy-D-manno-octulosonic acid transferase n=1 Tax=Lamprobacter sp. TaxID=3100796 RepID=UPI002B258C68|nr:lipid IV(A) 3-deoxy-D-manno-octulosonic acid transferase [Lamprobacter sp.]MEA3638962.1 lipid IV(A) 3-deoxy-D-manno-octulosonic acid transferase [Lamprobacter sp.]